MASTQEKAGKQELIALLDACAADQRQAQKALYDHYASFVFGIIRLYVKDYGHAEEILNDTFLKVFRNISQYRFEGAFEGWLRRICLHQISDHFRKKINRNPELAEVTDEQVSIDADGLAAISQKELLQLIHELPDTQRLVFNLFAFENFSHAQIGQELNITENNSRWHLSDARKRLKEKLLFNSRFRGNETT